MKKQLILGSGSRVQNDLFGNKFEDTVTIDIFGTPDIIHNLNDRPLPFYDNTFDEIHAYEVLEHIGIQGDFKSFFEEFTEYHRILKPDGMLLATVPKWDNMWAWGDPGHTRIINDGTLIFLDQKNYEQTGKTPMSDYREIYKVSFNVVSSRYLENHFMFILRAKK